jgi:hypothetical protein
MCHKPFSKRTVSLLLAIIFLSCTQENNTTKKKESKSEGTKVVVRKHDNGNIKAEVAYKDGKQNGLSKSYDRNGKLILELPYLNGKRDGLSKKYFEGGRQLYQTTEYKNDKMHGMQVKYRENGKVMSEARYENNFPCLGLKEYLLDNTMKKKYPKINITPIDQLEEQGTYTLEISMSEKVRSVKYYAGKLSKEGCLHEDLYFILLNQNKKTGQLKYNLPPGGFKMEEVNIIAVVETILGNTYITQRTYNLAIDN